MTGRLGSASRSAAPRPTGRPAAAQRRARARARRSPVRCRAHRTRCGTRPCCPMRTTPHASANTFGPTLEDEADDAERRAARLDRPSVVVDRRSTAPSRRPGWSRQTRRPADHVGPHPVGRARGGSSIGRRPRRLPRRRRSPRRSARTSCRRPSRAAKSSKNAAICSSSHAPARRTPSSAAPTASSTTRRDPRRDVEQRTGRLDDDESVTRVGTRRRARRRRRRHDRRRTGSAGRAQAVSAPTSLTVRPCRSDGSVPGWAG